MTEEKKDEPKKTPQQRSEEMQRTITKELYEPVSGNFEPNPNRKSD